MPEPSLTGATYDGEAFSYLPDAVEDVFVKSGGTQVYYLNATADLVHAIDLDTAYDLTTGWHDQTKTGSISAGSTSATAMWFKSDGTKLYVLDSTDVVYQYSLSTAWDVTTISYDTVSFSVTTQEATPRGLTFSSDGTIMYVVGTTGDTVYQYSLSTAWNLSTASYASKSFSVATQTTAPTQVRFKSDGTKMYVQGGLDIYQYGLSTAWDVSTASYDSLSATVTGTNTESFFITSDGGYLFTSSNGQTISEAVWRFGTAWTLSTLTEHSRFSMGWNETTVSGVAVSSAEDKVFLSGSGQDDVATFSVDTVRDFNRWRHERLQGLDVVDTTPSGLAFKPDGTKMFVVGAGSDIVRQWSLSTAWNPATGTAGTSSPSIAVNEGTSTGLAFKSDGTKMYVIGSDGDAIDQYSLSTAWDVSTATYDSVTFSVATQTTAPTDFCFSSTGVTLFVVAGSTVYQYTLSTAWDISTAAYNSLTLSTASQETALTGCCLSSDNVKLYLIGTSADSFLLYTVIAGSTVAGNTATETDTAQAGTVSLGVPGGTATETDTANPGTVAGAFIVPGTAATETDAAQAGSVVLALVVAGGTATETDAAQAGSVVVDAVIPGATAAESDAAQAGTPAVVLAGAAAAETDTAQAGSVVETLLVAGNTATETDAAQAGVVSGAFIVPGATAAETDAAQAGTVSLGVPGGTATETDTAQAGTVVGAFVVPGGTATETGSAQAGTVLVAIAGATASESDTAAAGTVAAVVTGATAAEVDAAQAGSVTYLVLGGTATEADTAQAGNLAVVIPGSTASETAAAAAGAVLVVIAGASATETDAAQAGTIVQVLTVLGTTATESDVAQAGDAVVALAVLLDFHDIGVRGQHRARDPRTGSSAASRRGWDAPDAGSGWGTLSPVIHTEVTP